MKKFLILAAAIAFGLAACGHKEEVSEQCKQNPQAEPCANSKSATW